MVAPVLEVESLTVAYGERLVLDQVGLAVGTGVTFLIGVNGAGKTTLLNAIAGNIGARGARIAIDGRPPVPGSIALMPQTIPVLRWLTALQYVQYVGYLRGLPEADLPDEATRALRLVDLMDEAATRTNELSGGQRQRLGLAATVMGSPRVLLLDEPTAGLDPVQRLQFRTIIDQMADQTCIVISTHLLDDVDLAADRVQVLADHHITLATRAQDIAGGSLGQPDAARFRERILSLMDPDR
ncbi:MAG: ATP-binding cassette domain-containing protein [Bifidobacteriaceae bacterium]|nr:ATP-binding cassette domain-containing protein [Bifidobacteriaceae bacterium]